MFNTTIPDGEENGTNFPQPIISIFGAIISQQKKVPSLTLFSVIEEIEIQWARCRVGFHAHTKETVGHLCMLRDTFDRWRKWWEDYQQ